MDFSQSCAQRETFAVLPPCIAQADTRVATHSWGSLNPSHIFLGWTQFHLQVTCNRLQKMQPLKKKKDLDSKGVF